MLMILETSVAILLSCQAKGYLLHFAWEDQRVQQCYNLSSVIELWLYNAKSSVASY